MLGKDTASKYTALQSFLDTLEDPEPTIELPPMDSEPKRKGGRPKGAKNRTPRLTKAQLEARKAKDAEEAGKPLTEKEVADFRARDAANTPDQDAAIRRAIEEVVKPVANVAGPDGFRHIRVNLTRHGESVPSSGHKWIAGLRNAGIQVDEKIFSCVLGGMNGVPKGQMELIF